MYLQEIDQDWKVDRTSSDEGGLVLAMMNVLHLLKKQPNTHLECPLRRHVLHSNDINIFYHEGFRGPTSNGVGAATNQRRKGAKWASNSARPRVCRSLAEVQNLSKNL